MEQIDSHVDQIKLDQLRLCPDCYLVAWTDETGGVQTREGVPVPINSGLAPKVGIGYCPLKSALLRLHPVLVISSYPRW